MFTAVVNFDPKVFHCSVFLQIANPPLMGILGGISIGISPLGTLLYQPNSPAAMATTLGLPAELRACLGDRLFRPRTMASLCDEAAIAGPSASASLCSLSSLRRILCCQTISGCIHTVSQAFGFPRCPSVF